MAMNSGKSYSDFGIYDNCEESELTRYALLTVYYMGVPISMGLCLPVQCDYSSIDPIQAALTKMALEAGLGRVEITIPSLQSFEISPLRVFGFIFYGMIVCFLLVGLLTEYTFLFGGSGIEGQDKKDLNDRNKDKELMKEKSKIGQFFLCWSPARNL